MYRSIAANKRNTFLIMALFVGLVGAIGWAISYYYGNTNITYFVVGVAAVYALIQYFAAAKLATAMTGAIPIEKQDSPRLYRIVENLAITTGMPTPKVYIINDPAPNAFATGRDPRHAIVAATTGLLDIMDDQELEAVMAHEMGHVLNYDIRLSMIAFGLASAIGLITDIAFRMMFFGGNRRESNDSSGIGLVIGIVVLILAPIAAAMIQLAISRQREYLADATSAMTTRNPDSMISALEKLKQFGKPMIRQTTSASHLFIAESLKPGVVGKLFSTHPPIDERISRLKANEGRF